MGVCRRLGVWPVCERLHAPSGREGEEGGGIELGEVDEEVS